ncbi:MAG TPA: SpoIIIAH-like family protein [Bacillota bacterium]|nr:SpoIIIAH-like family protein [Bacillota bacterium]
MKRYKKMLWVAMLLLLAGVTVWVISGLERERQTSYDVVTDDELQEVLTGMAEDGDWGYDEGGAFFMEYRLQRDRVRAQEMEMLEGIINNPNTSAEAKEEAEDMLMELVKLMEQELLIENMIKAQGYEDAVFFYRNRVATVMVKKQELSEREFVQIAETVAGVAGVEKEEIQVISRY